MTSVASFAFFLWTSIPEEFTICQYEKKAIPCGKSSFHTWLKESYVDLWAFLNVPKNHTKWFQNCFVSFQAIKRFLSSMQTMEGQIRWLALILTLLSHPPCASQTRPRPCNFCTIGKHTQKNHIFKFWLFKRLLCNPNSCFFVFLLGVIKKRTANYMFQV